MCFGGFFLGSVFFEGGGCFLKTGYEIVYYLGFSCQIHLFIYCDRL